MTEQVKLKRALISVWDKSGLDKLIPVLARNSVEIVSSSGTADHIENLGVTVTRVENLTGFPEILSGRVKTLHPMIHGAILAPRDRASLDEIMNYSIEPIDLVIINLYPFWEFKDSEITDQELIEYIDIGGPAMIRAAAKNYRYVTAVPSSKHYDELITELEQDNGISLQFRQKMMAETFRRTSEYDQMIACRFSSNNMFNVSAASGRQLRYGENPHQEAVFYTTESCGIPSLEKLSGKELSYNNLLDVDACIRLLSTFSDSECFYAVLKHTNPCGLALGDIPCETYIKALSGDPVSAFGGIVVTNSMVDEETAVKMRETFLEIILAPEFSDNALKVLKKRKNLRLLSYDPGKILASGSEYRSLSGGLLVQERDTADFEVKTVSKNKPTEQDLMQLKFAQKVVRHLKSNAISICRDFHLAGAGMGQVSRVDAAHTALKKAGERAKQGYMASDAFFPFPDCIELAHSAGVRAVIEPGGSRKDEEVIKRADELGMILVFTGIRHFWH